MRVRRYLIGVALFAVVSVFFLYEKQNGVIEIWKENYTENLTEAVETAFEQFFQCKKSPGGNFRNIYLIKSFKAASSTLSNVLYRYGMKHRLNFIQPEDDSINQIFPYSCSDTAARYPLIPPCNGTYNLNTIHSRFDGRAKLAGVMPENTLIIGSVRNPGSQMMSAYNYFIFGAELAKMNITFLDFIGKPKEYTQTYIHLMRKNREPTDQLVNLGLWNQQSQVYGLSDFKIPPWVGKEEILKNREYQNEIENFLTRVDKEVDFVFITENFVESMAIFRKIFDMDLNDVAYIGLNQAKQNNSDKILTKNQQDLVMEWNYIDWLLYQRMVDKFNKLKNTLKFNLEFEIDKLNGVNKKISKFCLKKKDHVILKGAHCLYKSLQLNEEGMNNVCCRRVAEQEWDINRLLKGYMKEKNC